MRRLLLSCVGLMAMAGALSANPLCTANSMAYYMANYTDANTACQVGDKLFFGFNYSVTARGTTGPTNTQVTVTGDSSNPNEPGLVFASSGWSVSGNATLLNPLYIDSNITFTVAVVGLQPLMVGATLDMLGHYTVGGQGVANIGETVLINGGSSGSVGLAVDSNAGPYTDSKSFAPASFVRVSKDLIVTVPRPLTGTNSGSASISQFREGFSELTSTPEPLTFTLLGSGLIGLAMVRRRRR